MGHIYNSEMRFTGDSSLKVHGDLEVYDEELGEMASLNGVPKDIRYLREQVKEIKQSIGKGEVDQRPDTIYKVRKEVDPPFDERTFADIKDRLDIITGWMASSTGIPEVLIRSSLYRHVEDICAGKVIDYGVAITKAALSHQAQQELASKLKEESKRAETLLCHTSELSDRLAAAEKIITGLVEQVKERDTEIENLTDQVKVAAKVLGDPIINVSSGEFGALDPGWPSTIQAKQDQVIKKLKDNLAKANEVIVAKENRIIEMVRLGEQNNLLLANCLERVVTFHDVGIWVGAAIEDLLARCPSMPAKFNQALARARIAWALEMLIEGEDPQEHMEKLAFVKAEEKVDGKWEEEKEQLMIELGRLSTELQASKSIHMIYTKVYQDLIGVLNGRGIQLPESCKGLPGYKPEEVKGFQTPAHPATPSMGYFGAVPPDHRLDVGSPPAETAKYFMGASPNRDSDLQFKIDERRAEDLKAVQKAIKEMGGEKILGGVRTPGAVEFNRYWQD